MSMSNKYILVDKKPVPCDDLHEWAKWLEKNDRTVAKTTGTIKNNGVNMGEITISTVFLGLDHNFDEDGEPVLFETFVFGGPLDEEMDRCSTWEGAEKMHQLMIEKVKRSVDNLTL